MPETIVDLGRKVKAKHPEYADMADEEVGRRVKAKYPQQYGDFTDVTPAASAEQPGYFEQTALFHPARTAQSLVQTALHPIDALQGWIQQNQELGQRALDAFKAGNYAEGLRHGSNYLANMVPGVGAKLDTAGNQLEAGDTGQGLTTTASLATDLLAGAKAPAVVNAATEPGALAVPGQVVGAALKAGGGDVTAGAAKTAAGMGLATAVKDLQLPGQLMTDLSFAYPLVKSGVRQVGRGLKAGYAAGSDVLATRPVDTSLPGEAAAAPPAVFGDPNAFSKLPPALQEAILRGQNKVTTQPSAPAPTYTPRSPEYYGVQGAVHPTSQDSPVPAERATPTTPPPTGPQAAGQHPVYSAPLTRLDSEAIQSIRYHPESQTALIDVRGRQYQLPMSPEQHGRILAASADPNASVGDIWNKEIRPTLETASGVLRPKQPAAALPETTTPTMEQRLAASPDAMTLRQAIVQRAAGQHLNVQQYEALAHQVAAEINTARSVGGNAKGVIPTWVVQDVIRGFK